MSWFRGCFFFLPPQSLSHQMRDPGMRHTVHQIIYDEIISAILKIINRLNLSSKPAALEVCL